MRKYKLSVHVKVEHENIKPYSCGICNASYVHMKNCAQHIATKHENWSQEKADQDYATIAKEHTAFVRNFSVGSRSANYKWVASGPRTSTQQEKTAVLKNQPDVLHLCRGS